MIPLTNDQRRLVSDNIRLAFKVACGDDDRVQDAFLGLCLAVRSWDPARGGFGAHAWFRMLDSLRSRSVVPTVGLSDDVPGAEGLTYEDTLAYTDALPVDVQAERAELLRKVAKAVEGLHPLHREILLRRAAGEYLEGIGATLGLSAERIRQIEAEALSTVRRRLR